MPNANTVRRGAGCFLVGLAYPILGILGLLIHIWTVVIAFLSGGIITAAISLIFPVLAQIYWGY